MKDYSTLFDKIYAALDSWLELQSNSDRSGIDLPIQPTRPEFEGTYTVVLFPWTKALGMPLPDLGSAIGAHLKSEVDEVIDFNLVKGFLNLSLSSTYWLDEVDRQYQDDSPIPQVEQPKKILIEYGSPNANKPLHLGHLRNLLLGWSVGKLLSAIGHDIHYTQIVNDRGIAICKSMMSYQLLYPGQAPKDHGMKSDHFIGKCYVQFAKLLTEEYTTWQSSDVAQSILASQPDDTDPEEFFDEYKNEYFNLHSPLGSDTREMLRAWESGDQETVSLWRQLKDWFMQGFNETIDRLGLHFDSMQHESDTYLLGKDIIEQGLTDGVFERDPDGSLWIDLTADGLDRKLVLRSDGTSVYMTQDIGTAQVRHQQFKMDGVIYTVGNEQEYHFQALFHILRHLGAPYADLLYHLSYGMVELPSGKMKTREGTVVDADDLIDEVISRVEENSRERGELDALSNEERTSLIEAIGLGALKYYMLRVEARRGMLFNPDESVDLQGQTGPYIQNAFVRIKSVLRRWSDQPMPEDTTGYHPSEAEQSVLVQTTAFGSEIMEAADKKDPSIVARYAYDLAKRYHKFYHDHSILHAEDAQAQAFRIKLSILVADRLERAMDLLGITMPERM